MPFDPLTTALRWSVRLRASASGVSLEARVRLAIAAGATLLRYPSATFDLRNFQELAKICHLCRANGVVLLLEDNPLLARSLDANGIHWTRPLAGLPAARDVLSENALIGADIPLADPAAGVDPGGIDYLSVQLSPDAWRTQGQRNTTLAGIRALASGSPLPLVVPMVADAELASLCLEAGAAGVVIEEDHGQKSAGTRQRIAAALGCVSRETPVLPWRDEFQLIHRLLTRQGRPGPAEHPAVRVPPGDDACLLAPLTRPVITTDTQREGVHFRFEWQAPQEIGERAVNVALSDLAASYATPVGLFINLSLPDWMPERTVIALYRGVEQALGAHGAALGGGNVSRGREFAMDLFAVGEGRPDLFPTRSAARPGFGLYATGPLGLARAGLEALRLKDPGFPHLIEHFKRPVARFKAATVLAEHGVQCVMDISDGLAGDARHMAEASGVSIEIDVTGMEQGVEFTAFCRKYGRCPETLAISGGDDYELLFACPPEIFESIRRRLPQALQVGRILAWQGHPLVGKAAGIRSFQHGEKKQ